jgi:hypothetical protein
MKVKFSQEIINYIIRNDLNLKKKNSILKNPLQAYHYCECLHHTHGHKFYIGKCDYDNCNCISYKQLRYKIEIYTLKDEFKFKYIHKSQSSRFWKVIEIQTKQSGVIRDYVYENTRKDNLPEVRY